VAKYPYPFKQGILLSVSYYPIRIRENCGCPQNNYPRIYIRAPLDYPPLSLEVTPVPGISLTHL